MASKRNPHSKGREKSLLVPCTQCDRPCIPRNGLCITCRADNAYKEMPEPETPEQQQAGFERKLNRWMA